MTSAMNSTNTIAVIITEGNEQIDFDDDNDDENI
jgi:hypothetical protein